MPALIDTLNDKDTADDMRKVVAETLGFLGKEANSACPALAKALQAGGTDVRRAAALSLEKIGPDALSALPELEKAVQDGDRFVRTLALHTIGSFGPAAGKATPALLEGARDQVSEVRLAAIEALGRVAAKDNQKVLDALKDLTRDGQPVIRDAAAAALEKIQERP